MRRIKLIQYRDGHGSIGFKVNLPKKWAEKIKDINNIVILENNKSNISILANDQNFILIKETSFRYYNNVNADFLLENNMLLFSENWNGKLYSEALNLNDEKIVKSEFIPIYKYQFYNIKLEEIEENSTLYDDLTTIVAFKMN